MPLAFDAPVAVWEGCASCWEPTVAIDAQGRVFVTNGWATGLWRSDDGGASFQRLAVPPPPPGAFGMNVFGRGDAMLDAAPDGMLYFSAVVGGFGIQVAASGDGGETWPVNTYAMVPASPDPPQAGADRQWLAFGEHGEMYLTYQRNALVNVANVLVLPPPERGIVVARSDDGGRTWSTFRSIHPEGEAALAVVNGRPLVHDGALFIPHFFLPDSGDTALRLAVSRDGGESFSSVDVHAPPGERAGSWFPSLAFDGRGGAIMAWHGAEAALLAARSLDGGLSWSEPVVVHEGPIATSPWVEVRGEEAVLAWFAGDGNDGDRLLIASLPLHDPEAWPGAKPVDVARDTGIHTDFSHLTLNPDGRTFVVWANADEGRIALAATPLPLPGP